MQLRPCPCAVYMCVGFVCESQIGTTYYIYDKSASRFSAVIQKNKAYINVMMCTTAYARTLYIIRGTKTLCSSENRARCMIDAALWLSYRM